MQPFLIEKQPEIAELCRRHHVLRLWVFGSAVREDFDPESSDVDFLVEFDPESSAMLKDDYFGLWDDLRELMAREVDLLTLGGLRNVYLKKIVFEQRRELYVAA